MNCKTCKNYVPKGEAKPKPKTTVTVWGGYDCAVIHRLVERFSNHVMWEPHADFLKAGYTFTGIPDIDRVVRETLDVGSLVVKVECPGYVRVIDDHSPHDAAYIFINGLCCGWDYNGKYSAWYVEQISYLTDTDIDDAVAKYLAAQKPKDKPAFKAGDIVRAYHGMVGEIEALLAHNKASVRFLDGNHITILVGDLSHIKRDERKKYEAMKYTFTLPGGVKIRAYDDGERVPIVLCVQDATRHWYTREAGEAICAALVSEDDGRRGLPIKKLAPGESPEYPEGDGK